MRISTAQMFNQNINSVLDKQFTTRQILEQISSGKRVNTAADDPIASIGIDNLKQKNALVDQFMKNIDYATGRLAITESKLGSAENSIMSIKEKMLYAVNGSLDANGRQLIADDMKATLEELLSIANSQDESGNYMFGGNETNILPFAFDNAGDIVYSGDSGVRQSIVALGVTVGTNVPGDMAFMLAPNAMGDFSANYLASQVGEARVKNASIVIPGAHIPVVPESYNFQFTDNGSGGIRLEVYDFAATLQVLDANFDATIPVTFNGIEVNLDGNPSAGDSFTLEPQTQVSIFDTLNSAISLLEDPNRINTPEGMSELAQLLGNVDSGVNQVNISRGIAGNNLKSIEGYTNTHVEEKLVNTSALSMLEDLDFAAAYSEYKKQQVALTAVSMLFSRVGSTSLFDYL